MYLTIRVFDRANLHSAYYRFSERRLTLEILAYRTIQPGEEITISCKCSLVRLL
jgi:hypothetical protein